MNATARTSLIATAAIAAACWAVPAFLVGAVPPDAGMFAMMALLYALLPITAVALGMLATGSARTLFWLPAALGAAFALLFPLAVEDSQDIAFYGIAYAASPTPHRLRRHGPARQHGQAVSPTTLNQMPIKGRTGPALSIRLTDLRCTYWIFGAPVSHFPFG